MAMYWDFERLPKNFKEFKVQYKKYVLENKDVEESEDVVIIKSLYFDPDCRPADLFISKDDKVYVKYDTLCSVEDNQTIIRTYTINDNCELIDNREMPISTYQNFTHQRLKKMKKVFISYSHDDLIYRKELQTYLVNLERENKIEIWHDGLIDAGSGWNEKIIDKLKESDIIILLISQTFISSKYIHEVEMKKALEQMQKGHSKIIPILVSNCDWNNWNVFLENSNNGEIEEEISKGKLNNYQLMPMNEENQRLEPINRWKYREDAWTKIIKQIRDFTNN
jgi:internalin A